MASYTDSPAQRTRDTALGLINVIAAKVGDGRRIERLQEIVEVLQTKINQAQLPTSLFDLLLEEINNYWICKHLNPDELRRNLDATAIIQYEQRTWLVYGNRSKESDNWERYDFGLRSIADSQPPQTIHISISRTLTSDTPGLISTCIKSVETISSDMTKTSVSSETTDVCTNDPVLLEIYQYLQNIRYSSTHWISTDIPEDLPVQLYQDLSETDLIAQIIFFSYDQGEKVKPKETLVTKDVIAWSYPTFDLYFYLWNGTLAVCEAGSVHWKEITGKSQLLQLRERVLQEIYKRQTRSYCRSDNTLVFVRLNAIDDTPPSNKRPASSLVGQIQDLCQRITYRVHNGPHIPSLTHHGYGYNPSHPEKDFNFNYGDDQIEIVLARRDQGPLAVAVTDKVLGLSPTIVDNLERIHNYLEQIESRLNLSSAPDGAVEPQSVNEEPTV